MLSICYTNDQEDYMMRLKELKAKIAEIERKVGPYTDEYPVTTHSRNHDSRQTVISADVDENDEIVLQLS